MSRLRTSNLFGHLTHRVCICCILLVLCFIDDVLQEPSIAGSDTDSIVSVAPMEVSPFFGLGSFVSCDTSGQNFKGLADEVLDSKLQEALKLVTAITTARTQRLAHSHPN
jgi:hypothetical protein